MNKPAGVCLAAIEANSGVKRISITEFAAIIPEVYPVIYSLKPLSRGMMVSEISGVFSSPGFAAGFSFGPQELIKMINTVILKLRNFFMLVAGCFLFYSLTGAGDCFVVPRMRDFSQ
jgi:hypothetical protein